MSKKTTFPPTPKKSLDDDAARPALSSEWLNHSSDGPATRDIFQQRPSRKRRLLRFAGVAAVWTARNSFRGSRRLARFGYRQMQPMRVRDWVTLGALAAVLLAMGAYMTFEKR